MQLRTRPLNLGKTQRIVFIHVPKTGGSAILSALKKMTKSDEYDLPGHLRYQEVDHGLREARLLDPYFSFAVVRNPWDWHVSWYHYLKNDRDGRDSGHLIEHELFNRISFPDYVRWLEDESAIRSPQGFLIQEQIDWLVGEDRIVAVDKVLKFERLERDFIDLLKLLGCWTRSHLQIVNASMRQRDYRFYYDTKAVEIISTRHSRDIAAFGYEF